MLTEEAHHMFVGETGVQRIVQRTCQAMRDAGIDDPTDTERVRALGVIDLPTLQKKANLHFSLTLDLFGNEISTNAANAFNAGLKGRYHEDKLTDDHVLTDATYPVLRLKDGVIVREDTPALSALNMRLRDDFVDDANAGVTRWNRVLERAGLEFRLRLPHVAFNRRIGEFAAIHADADGNLMTADQWQARKETMLPSADDNRFVESLMRATHAPGAYASWIAPPRIGIDNKPGNFEYVKIEA
jgi:benzoyl-CoA 2,3-dioxygenase component B